MASGSEEVRYRMLVEHCLDAVALVQPDGRISYVSPPITRILGYTPAEFVGLDAFQVVHPEDREASRVRFLDLIKAPGRSQTVVNRVQHKDGSWRWIETHSMNQLNVSGIEAVIANFREITDRRLAAEKIRHADEKFRLIVESATEFAIFTTDLNGKVDSWNTGAARLLGYSEAEILGQDLRIFFTPEDNARDKPEAEMHDAVSWGCGNDERWHVMKDGSRFWASGLMMPFRDDAGTIRGYLKIFRDMTREKRSAEALQEADRRKDEFLAILSHELRNPVAAISNAAVLLGMSPGGNHLEWSRDVIERQTRHLARLLEDLLDVSRITQGKIRLKQERLDLAASLGRAVDVVRPQIEQKKQNLTLAISPEMILVWADATRVEQILVNLLTNAIKYTNEGGAIIVTAHCAKQAMVSVRDFGVGIEPEMLPRIFELFAQADGSLDRSQGGLGVGLTLARSLVEMHGGKIWAHSDGLDRGSEFTFTLPLAEPKQEPLASP